MGHPVILLSYTSINIITQNNLIHSIDFTKWLHTYLLTHYLRTYNVDTRDTIGSKKKVWKIPH